MKWTFAILVLAAAAALSSTSASAYSYRHHYYRGFYNSMNMMPGYWAGYRYRYSSLPGGGMLDPRAALSGSPAGGAGAVGP